MHTFEPKSLRQTVLRMAYTGSTVHVPCAFSIIEILAVLYRSHVRLGDGAPSSQERDYVVLSKGHGVMAQYACLHELGWLPLEELERYFGDGTRLKGLCDAHVPGLEVTSGSLGHGLSVAVGMALASKRIGTDQRVFAILGDGEINEGSIWEAILFAAHMQLSNLCLVIDANGFQAMGKTKDVLDLGSIARKLEAFQCEVLEVDGHSETALDQAFKALLLSSRNQPKAIVAHTIKGKGVSFMENDNRWHYTRLTAETYASAMNELAN